MTLFETLYSKIMKAVEEDPAYLTSNEDHLSVIDKDIIENDAQPADCYIVILKGNGCGTNLMLCDANSQTSTDHNLFIIDTDVKSSDHPSKFFAAVVSGLNEGTVEEVSEAEARSLVKNVGYSAYREPRRISAVEQFRKFIDCSPDDELLINQTLSPYLITTPNISYLIKLVADPSLNDLNVQITPTKGERAGITSTVRLAIDSNTLMRLIEPKAIKIDCTSGKHTDMAVLSDREFEQARRHFQPKQELNRSLDMGAF